ncbi:MAG: aldehyde reductase [Proteobacteria bacterium]|nr:aldehyde reductase [Pseudomonadota bacterium]
MSRVLVTGGSGFIAGHTILQLLAAGHSVHTTVRHLSRAADVRTTLKNHAAANNLTVNDDLTFFAAELEDPAGWREASRGCDYVLHVASPFPAGTPKDENALVKPAREGTLRVLRAARTADVKRVVVTSSFAAIGYGHKARRTPFTEDDWTDLSAPLHPYHRSKTLAEHAAWDFIEDEGDGMELAVVNPTSVFGPILGSRLSSSVELIHDMLEGKMPSVPKIYFGAVDVRDVADLHVRAMANPKAMGQRFIAIAGDCISLRDVATILRQRLGDAAQQAPKRQVPSFMVRLAALWSDKARQILPELGKVKHASSAKAKALLGWEPRPAEDAIAATAESLIAAGLVESGS